MRDRIPTILSSTALLLARAGRRSAKRLA